ncbi:hypothetical protein GDI0032 [Gluconacetobacter diazotrophicus PA1 5]|uniref:Uncharacterized protein n=1 Tax=Gluconacetobacter diazotrophicus (strain ATCC 49037 / DSM 5601 / CCUG 37298 / CIP 103539 / LMG 7603 / PAl5) TaxID=272568 RepID=A9GZL9_GLUDA|nr:hypothetical protein GDI0032 [Gluconacetobacter diazotrophicus PA1 5]
MDLRVIAGRSVAVIQDLHGGRERHGGAARRGPCLHLRSWPPRRSSRKRPWDMGRRAHHRGTRPPPGIPPPAISAVVIFPAPVTAAPHGEIVVPETMHVPSMEAISFGAATETGTSARVAKARMAVEARVPAHSRMSFEPRASSESGMPPAAAPGRRCRMGRCVFFTGVSRCRYHRACNDQSQKGFPDGRQSRPGGKSF